MSQTDPPPRLHLLGANWPPCHLKLKLSQSQKGRLHGRRCHLTWDVMSEHLGRVARDWRTFCQLGSQIGRDVLVQRGPEPKGRKAKRGRGERGMQSARTGLVYSTASDMDMSPFCGVCGKNRFLNSSSDKDIGGGVRVRSLTM